MELGYPQFDGNPQFDDYVAELTGLDAKRAAYDKGLESMRERRGLSLVTRIVLEEAPSPSSPELGRHRQEIYRALDQGQISPEDALTALRDLETSPSE